MILKSFLLTLFILVFLFPSLCQTNLGLHASTFSLPAKSLRVYGGGTSVQLDKGKGAFIFSLGYFSKRSLIDSFSSNGGYVKYQHQYRFLNFSADFIRFLVGSTSSRDKFSLFCGAGIALVYKLDKLAYLDNSFEPQNDNALKEGFEFLTGLDYKLGFARIYLKGKASIFLSHILQVSDDVAMPLLTNTEIGIQIPLTKN